MQCNQGVSDHQKRPWNPLPKTFICYWHPWRGRMPMYNLRKELVHLQGVAVEQQKNSLLRNIEQHPLPIHLSRKHHKTRQSHFQCLQPPLKLRLKRNFSPRKLLCELNLRNLQHSSWMSCLFRMTNFSFEQLRQLLNRCHPKRFLGSSSSLLKGNLHSASPQFPLGYRAGWISC